MSAEVKAAEHVKTCFSNDRTALTIFAALLMTVNFAMFPVMIPAAFRAENTHNDSMQLLACFAFGLGAATSLGTVIMGTWQFLVMNKLHVDRIELVHAAIDMCERAPLLLWPVNQVKIGVYATCCGTLSLVYLNQGWKPMVCTGCPMIVFVVSSFFSGTSILGRTHKLAGQLPLPLPNPSSFAAGDDGFVPADHV